MSVCTHEAGGSGLPPARFEVPRDGDADAGRLLVGAARPVLDQLAEDLAPATTSVVVLTDHRARVLDRRVRDPGLTTMACAAAPITDPRSGRLLGIVDLTCSADDAGLLILPLARRAARDIEQRLLDDARRTEQIVLRRFLEDRRRAKGPIVFVNERTMITNAAADRLVEPADEAILWDGAKRSLATGDVDPRTLVLNDGSWVLIRSEPVVDGGILLGALVRITPVPPDGTSLPRMGSRPRFGWESLTDTERSVVGLVAQGLTNRQIGQRLLVSPHTVDFHMRAVFQKLDVGSRVELTRAVLQHDDGGRRAG